MKKTVLFVIVLGFLGALGWGIHVRLKEAQATKGKDMPGKGGPRGRGVVAVELAPVRKATVRDVGRFTGSLIPKSQFILAPKIPGRLEKLSVNIGDLVSPGQVIAELDDEEYAQQVEQAKAERDIAEATVAECDSALAVARSEYFDRVKPLYDQKIASKSDLEQAEARFKAAEAKQKVALAQVQQKKAALKGAEVRLSYTKILATWANGAGTRVVGKRFIDQGAMLKANDPIVSILDISSVTAVLHVIERDYPRVKVGQEVTIATDAYPGRRFPGKVVRIAPLLEETSRQARVEVEAPNPEMLLRSGMFVRAEIEFDRHEDVPVVPISALAKRNGQSGVFLADIAEKTAKFVPLTIGIIDGELAEVVEPTLNGMVVTIGHHLLETGTEIVVPGSGGGSTTRPAGTGTSKRGRPDAAPHAPKRAR